MSEIKVRLSLCIPGARRLSWQECQKNPKESYDETRIKVSFKDKRGKTCYERLTIKTRKSELVRQSIQISKEAYDYMISDEVPSNKLNKRVPFRVNGKRKLVPIWCTYTDDQKLRWHFQNIADTLGAKDFSYEILED